MTIGFIGLGNMGLAMLQGLKEKKDADYRYVVKSDASGKRLKEILGFPPSSYDQVYSSDVVFLAIKPKDYPFFLEELKDRLGEDQILISIAPGFSFDKLQGYFDEPKKLVRSMPATPAQVGKSVSAMCFSPAMSEQDKELVQELFLSFGAVHLLDESLLEAFGNLCGVMPAYLMMLLEAMGDQAVSWGIPRKQAYLMAAQIMEGSAVMLQETGLHPGELKDQVTSPGGTTIQGVLAFDEWGGRTAIQKAMQASYKKGMSL